MCIFFRQSLKCKWECWTIIEMYTEAEGDKSPVAGETSNVTHLTMGEYAVESQSRKPFAGFRFPLGRLNHIFTIVFWLAPLIH